MALADPRTDWTLLSTLLRLARRDGWIVVFLNGSAFVTHPRTAPGVVVLPAALFGHARAAGWRAARSPEGFELRHPSVRVRVEVRLAAA